MLPPAEVIDVRGEQPQPRGFSMFARPADGPTHPTYVMPMQPKAYLGELERSSTEPAEH